MDRQFGPPAPDADESMQIEPRGATCGGECRQRLNNPYRQQKAAEGEWLFRLLAEQQRVVLDQVVANQNMANQQMWDRVAQLLALQTPTETPPGAPADIPNPLPGMRA